jgi:transposase
LFEASAERVPDLEEVVADKGYDSWAVKRRVLAADMTVHIPSKSTAVEEWPIDAESYRQRNRVERLVNKLKQFRRIATRYDKLAESFLALIHLTLSFIKVRSIVNRA